MHEHVNLVSRGLKGWLGHALSPYLTRYLGQKKHLTSPAYLTRYLGQEKHLTSPPYLTKYLGQEKHLTSPPYLTRYFSAEKTPQLTTLSKVVQPYAAPPLRGINITTLPDKRSE